MSSSASNTPDTSSPDLSEVLSDARTIAVVGCSDDPTRTSYRIAQYMQERGYRIVPVNPNVASVLGETAYPDLPSIPADVSIDVVNIFRAPQHTADMVRDAVERVEATGETPVIWTQLGVSSPEARSLAAEAGLPYVRNRCIQVEHARRNS
jgi:predicted CoA-binding protein